MKELLSVWCYLNVYGIWYETFGEDRLDGKLSIKRISTSIISILRIFSVLSIFSPEYLIFFVLFVQKNTVQLITLFDQVKTDSELNVGMISF